MTLLVTLDQAKAHLHIVEDDSQDDDITLRIHAASAVVLDYLGDAAYTFTDTSGEPLEDSSGPLPVPYQVQMATLLMVGEFYRNREPATTDPVDAKYGYGYLPRSVIALLYPLRTPTIA
jgi:hypothetical protein